MVSRIDTRALTTLTASSSTVPPVHRLLVPRGPTERAHTWEMDFKSDLAKQWAEAFPKYLILEGTANYDGNGFHDNLKVHLAIRRDGQLESAGTILKPDIEKLLSVAVVSKFGNGSETVLDESVRKGTELGPDILELSPRTMVNSSEPTTAFVEQRLAEIVQKEVRSDLFPYAQSISLQFTKLAMYEQGGHFLEHRDTPHAPNHQGTLLVMLHSEHDGGDLIFNIDDDSQETWDVRTKGWTTDAVRWCAFHTDIPHKVEPVKSGVRAVLQFDIFVNHDSEHWDNDDDYDGESRLEKASTNKEVSRVNDTAVDLFVKRLMPQLKTQSIALPLFHAYQYSYVRPEFLKSADRMLFDALLKAGHTL